MVFGKLIGAVLGYLVAGPLGLLMGVVAGHMFDTGLTRQFGAVSPQRLRQARDTFFEVSFQLLGYLAKSDGRVSEAEVAQAEALMRELGIVGERRTQAIDFFKAGAADGFDMPTAVARFKRDCAGPQQIAQTLISALLSMAYADGELHSAERRVLQEVAGLLGIQAAAFEQLLLRAEAQAQFHRQQQSGYADSGSSTDTLAAAYRMLGVTADCSDRDLKQAYRRQMSQHHPDKLASQGLPEEMMKMATEKAQDIQVAYDLIKKSRARSSS